MELIILGVFMLTSFYFGMKAGKGEDPISVIKGFKPIVRTEEQEQKLVDKLRSK